MVHENEALIRALYAAFEKQDMAAVDLILADDIEWRTPGTGPHAGVRKGKQELYAVMGELAEVTGGTLRGELLDVLPSDHRVVVLQTTRGEREGKTPLNDDEVIVFRIREGKIAEAREYPADLYAMDRFFS
jgi:ketosteroid isomerase-like protein